MIVIISPEKNHVDEVKWVNAMFDQGLERYHVRKPFQSFAATLKQYERVKSVYAEKLVFHVNQVDLILPSNLKLHVNTAMRSDFLAHALYRQQVVSTSTHSVAEFNALHDGFKSAFLGPFFNSISKPNYLASGALLMDLEQRRNDKTNLIALGGINDQNLALIYPKVDGIALLGTIWNNDNPLMSFLNCKNRIKTLRG